MEINIAKIRDNLTDALNRVADAGERIVLTRRGKPVAALVSLEELAFLEELETRADIEAARKARAEGGKPIPLAQVMANHGIERKRRAKARKQA